MLVLSRKLDQEIVIDGNIRVVVLEVRGDRIKLGIAAPPEVPVHRAEIHDRIAAGLCVPARVRPAFCRDIAVPA